MLIQTFELNLNNQDLLRSCLTYIKFILKEHCLYRKIVIFPNMSNTNPDNELIGTRTDRRIIKSIETLEKTTARKNRNNAIINS